MSVIKTTNILGIRFQSVGKIYHFNDNRTEDLKIGDKLKPTIDQAIRLREKLLLVLSQNSLASNWVEREVETALEEETRRQQTVLFPVRLDQAVMETDEAWAADIRRTRHIGDFSHWKDHDAYQQAFAHLLQSLRAEGTQ